MISPVAREGYKQITPELLDRMTDEAREKREAGRQRAERDVETLTGIHGQEDVVARRRIQTLERSVERLERRLTAVEREAASPRQHPMRSLMRPAGGLAKDEEAEQRRRRLLLAAVAFGVGLMILLVGGGLWLFSSGTETPPAVAADVAAPESGPSPAARILGTDGTVGSGSAPEFDLADKDAAPDVDKASAADGAPPSGEAGPASEEPFGATDP